MSIENTSPPLNEAEYISLAEFRYQLRRFLRHMEDRCRALGVNPQQYQVVLAVKGLPNDQAPTIGRMAERMQLNHNSMVELVDRCERNGLLRRARSAPDRRLVVLTITAQGENLLRQLGSASRDQLRNAAPSLQALLGLTRDHGAGNSTGDESALEPASEDIGL